MQALRPHPTNSTIILAPNYVGLADSTIWPLEKMKSHFPLRFTSACTVLGIPFGFPVSGKGKYTHPHGEDFWAVTKRKPWSGRDSHWKRQRDVHRELDSLSSDQIRKGLSSGEQIKKIFILYKSEDLEISQYIDYTTSTSIIWSHIVVGGSSSVGNSLVKRSRWIQLQAHTNAIIQSLTQDEKSQWT